MNDSHLYDSVVNSVKKKKSENSAIMIFLFKPYDNDYDHVIIRKLFA